MVELGLELKVRFGFHDASFEGLLQHLNPSLGLLAGVCDSHVLPLTAQPLLLGLVHLQETRRRLPLRVHGYETTHVSTLLSLRNHPAECTGLTQPRSGAPAALCYLGGSMVEHLLPGGIQGVLAISHQTLLRHIDHLPGSCVHRNRSLIAQCCLLSLLLCLQRAGKTFINVYPSSISINKIVHIVQL